MKQISRIKSRYNTNNIFLSLVIYYNVKDDIDTITVNKEFNKNTDHYSTIIEIDSSTGRIIKNYDIKTFFSSMITLIDDEKQSLELLNQIENLLLQQPRGTIFQDYPNQMLEIGDIVHLSANLWFRHVRNFKKAVMINNEGTYKLY